MKFQIEIIALLAALLPVVSAILANPVDLDDRDVGLVERQRQYTCARERNNLGACNAAIRRLRGHEARGCDVWACIGAFAAVIPACGSAVDEFGLNPLADIACIGAVANFQGPCKGCEPF